MQVGGGHEQGTLKHFKALNFVHRLEEAKMKDCQMQAANHIQQLKQYITTHNLANVNPTGTLPPPLQRVSHAGGTGSVVQ